MIEKLIAILILMALSVPCAAVAQSAEQLICNQQVRGSMPLSGPILDGRIMAIPLAVTQADVGSSPTCPANFQLVGAFTKGEQKVKIGPNITIEDIEFEFWTDGDNVFLTTVKQHMFENRPLDSRLYCSLGKLKTWNDASDERKDFNLSLAELSIRGIMKDVGAIYEAAS